MMTRRRLLGVVGAVMAAGRSPAEARALRRRRTAPPAASVEPQTPGTSVSPHLFSPLQFRTLGVKNRVFRSNVSGRFDNYDGSGSQARINGYANMPLDGVWLRAPYLHNGSVPSLEELLEPPARRRASFYRGYDVYDPARVGFISNGDAARRAGALYETGRPGNGNAGHLYGVQLSGAEKMALIEFLKGL